MKQSENETVPSSEAHTQQQPQKEESAEGVFRHGGHFVRKYHLRILGISALMLVPVFWHRTVVAGDLGSHLYNVWLAQLIRHGQAPGLWLAKRWNNVLFDYLVYFFGHFFSLAVASKIVVSISILIFFWGAFALACAAARRAPWLLVPCFAMVCYGYTYQMGFMNYYLSLGLGFWGVAIIWRGKGWERLLPLVFAPLIVLANPLGLAWMLGAGGYIVATERIPTRYHFLLIVGAVAVLAGAHWRFWHSEVVEVQPKPVYYFNGTDQFLLFGDRYEIPQILFCVFTAVVLGLDFVARRRSGRGMEGYAIPLQFYFILLVAAELLPEGIRFASQPVALAILTERLSSVTAVILCCILAAMAPKKWHLAGFGAIAAIFFGFLYQDTAKAARMETQLEKLVRTIPPNQRVLGTIPQFPGARVLIQHMLDRACIGYCFSYGNYEAASQQFWVRASEGNPYLMTYFGDTSDMEDGVYEVKPTDLPAWQVTECDDSTLELCIRPLRAGQLNDDTADLPE